MKSKKNAATTPSDAWNRKGSTVSFSRQRRAALKSFADQNGGLSPAEAIYLLIDGIDSDKSKNMNARSIELAIAAPSDLWHEAFDDLKAGIHQSNRKADDNNETSLRCAESLELIANAMEPLKTLAAKLAPPNPPVARLNLTNWTRAAVQALGCLPSSALRADLQAKASPPSNIGTIEFKVIALGLGGDPMKSVGDEFPTLVLKDASPTTALAKRVASDADCRFRVDCSEAENGHRKARFKAIERGGSNGPTLLAFKLPV